MLELPHSSLPHKPPPTNPPPSRQPNSLDFVYKVRHDTRRYAATQSYLNSRILANTQHTIETVPKSVLVHALRTYRIKRTGAPLSASTITYLLYCIRLFSPSLKIFENDINIQHEHKLLAQHKAALVDPTTHIIQANAIDQQTEIVCRQLIVNYAKYLSSTSIIYCEAVRVKYSVACAVLLCVCTNLRSSELLQLTLALYTKIRQKELVPIRIKKRTKSCRLVSNLVMLARFDFAFRRAAINNYARRQHLGGGGGEDGLTLERIPIADISKSTLNRHIQEDFNRLGQTHKLDRTLDSYVGGIQLIRKINTTNLIADSAMKLAQVMNRHKNRATTLNYYDTNNYTASQLNSVFGQRKRQKISA